MFNSSSTNHRHAGLYNEDAKHVAHEAFNEAYRNHYGEVHPFEGGELELALVDDGAKVGHDWHRADR